MKVVDEGGLIAWEKEGGTLCCSKSALQLHMGKALLAILRQVPSFSVPHLEGTSPNRQLPPFIICSKCLAGVLLPLPNSFPSSPSRLPTSSSSLPQNKPPSSSSQQHKNNTGIASPRVASSRPPCSEPLEQVSSNHSPPLPPSPSHAVTDHPRDTAFTLLFSTSHFI